MKIAQVLPETPFWRLVAHFVKRLLAGEDEDAGEGMSLGLGAVLAILASPGGFVTILLMDKYSPLLQFMRGQRHFNPYVASISDQYFFVVLSMTITGLVMVLRWNRLFPDRRDFANLAVLPIPIRNVFTANFTALFALGLLFGIDVNAVSSLLFPIFVTITNGSVSAFLRVATSHAAAVLSASLFSFFGVFALVGVLMLVVPKRLFRPVSLLARILLVVGLLTEFFSNVFVDPLTGRSTSHPSDYARLLPSFWFLGVYENAMDIAKPAMAQLGHQALLVLAMLIFVSVVAYSFCYRRHFLRLAESLDITGSPRRHAQFVLPEWLQRLLFRSPFERACMSFTLKVLCRSERHLMFLGGYLGIGLVLVTDNAMNSFARAPAGAIPSAGILALPLMIAFFPITGLRFAFDIPASLNANWLFRLAAGNAEPSPRFILRKLMLLITLPLEILLLTPLMARGYGWQIAWEHTVIVMILTALSIETLLIDFRKIPFTCRSEPDVKRFLFRIIGAVLAFTFAVPWVAGVEHWMLEQPLRLIAGAFFVAAWCIFLQRHKRELAEQKDGLTFEERVSSPFELLKLA